MALYCVLLSRPPPGHWSALNFGKRQGNLPQSMRGKHLLEEPILKSIRKSPRGMRAMKQLGIRCVSLFLAAMMLCSVIAPNMAYAADVSTDAVTSVSEMAEDQGDGSTSSVDTEDKSAETAAEESTSSEMTEDISQPDESSYSGQAQQGSSSEIIEDSSESDKSSSSDQDEENSSTDTQPVEDEEAAPEDDAENNQDAEEAEPEAEAEPENAEAEQEAEDSTNQDETQPVNPAPLKGLRLLAAVSGTSAIGTDAIDYAYGSGITFKTKLPDGQFPDKVSGMSSKKTYSGDNDTWKGFHYYTFDNTEKSNSVYCDYYENGHYTDSDGKYHTLDTRIYMWVKYEDGAGCVTDHGGYVGAAHVLNATANKKRTSPCVIRFEYHFYKGGTLKNGTSSELSSQKGFIYFMDIDEGEGYHFAHGAAEYYTSNNTKLKKVGEDVNISDPYITYNGKDGYISSHYASGSFVGTTDTDTAAITDSDGANHALGVAFNATSSNPLRIDYYASSRFLTTTNDSTVVLNYEIVGTIPSGYTKAQLTPTDRHFAVYTNTSTAQSLFNASSVVNVPGYVFSGWNTSHSGSNLTGSKYSGTNLMKSDVTIYGKYSTGTLKITKELFTGDSSDITGSESVASLQSAKDNRVKFVFTITGADSNTRAFLNNGSKTVTIYGSDSATLTPMLPGTYTITESTVNATGNPMWFQSDTAAKTVTVSADATATATFKNNLRRRTITVKKTFSKNYDFSLLTDADKRFQFTLKGTTLLGTSVNKTVTVTGAGTATFNLVHPGDYTITETASNVWKTVSVKTVKVRENSVLIDNISTDTATFSNTLKTMPLKIHKVDSNGSPLSGAEFAIYRKSDVDAAISKTSYASNKAYAAGSPEYYTEFFKLYAPTKSTPTRMDTFQTDASGYGQSNIALPCTTYVLWETSVPKQQLEEISATLFSITADADEDKARGGSGVYELGFDLTDLDVHRSVLITKQDADTKKTVKKAGTSYLIYKVQDGNLTDGLYYEGNKGTRDNPWVSGADGTIRIDEIPFGTYCVVEAQAVTGYRNLYAATGETQPSAFFTVAHGQPSERMYALKNGTLTTSLNLDADSYLRDHTGAILTYDVIKVTYTNPETRGNLTIQKSGNVVVDYKDGQFVYEKQRLDGAAYRVTAAEDINAPDNQTVWYHKGDEIAVAVTGQSGTVSYLDGATFTSKISNSNCPYAAISNTDTGEVSLTLPLGKYTVTEIHAPEGYELNATSQQAELAWTDQEAKKVDATVSFENEMKEIYGELVKTDFDTEQPMEGVIFDVYNASDLFGDDGKVLLNADTLLGTVTTDKDGYAKTEVLPFYLTSEGKEGKYYLKESKPVMRYEPNYEKYYFPNRDSDKPFLVKAQNIPAARISIEKDQSLNGAERTKDELKVLPNDVITYYVTVTCDADNKRPATDMTISDTIPEGLILVDNTISGNGILDDDTITWTVDKLEVGESATVSFACEVPVVEGETHYHNAATCLYKLEEIPTNEVHAVERLGSISITKYKGEGSAKLAGVTFTLTKPDGTVVDTQTTDRSGKVKFSLLPAHDETYIVRETNTVNGYQLLAEPITVTLPLSMTQAELEAQGADPQKAYHDEEAGTWRFYDLSYEVRNGKVFDLPVTGSNDSGWRTLLVVLSIGILSYFIAFSDTLKSLFSRKRKTN